MKQTFHLDMMPPETVRHAVWKKLKSGHWQSGNIQLRLVSFTMNGSYRHEQWGIWVQCEGKWFQCYCKGRPWFYGSPGQAKCGISKVREFIFGNPREGRDE